LAWSSYIAAVVQRIIDKGIMYVMLVA